MFLNRKKEVRGGREGKVLRRKERTIKPRERDRKRNQKSEHRNIGLKHFKKNKKQNPISATFSQEMILLPGPNLSHDRGQLFLLIFCSDTGGSASLVTPTLS